MNIYEKLSKIQEQLKAPKNRVNTFANFNYRSCEDILEEVKPICRDNGAVLVVTDDIVNLGDRYYIKGIATLIDLEKPEDRIQGQAFAREALDKTKMDDSQITGTASSYARKYALNGLFNIDDTKDADTDEFVKVMNKENKPEKIDEKKNKALVASIENAGIKDEKVMEILKQYGYENTKDILLKDYMKIVNKFKELKEVNQWTIQEH